MLSLPSYDLHLPPFTSWQICDGVRNCKKGEDERECTGVGLGLGVVEAGMTMQECTLQEPYRCPSGLCLAESAVCDRRLDCPDGDDEKNCLDDNFDGECVGWASQEICALCFLFLMIVFFVSSS